MVFNGKAKPSFAILFSYAGIMQPKRNCRNNVVSVTGGMNPVLAYDLFCEFDIFFCAGVGRIHAADLDFILQLKDKADADYQRLCAALASSGYYDAVLFCRFLQVRCFFYHLEEFVAA